MICTFWRKHFKFSTTQRNFSFFFLHTFTWPQQCEIEYIHTYIHTNKHIYASLSSEMKWIVYTMNEQTHKHSAWFKRRRKKFRHIIFHVRWSHTQTQSNRLNQLHFGEEKDSESKRRKETYTRSVDFVTVSVDGVYLLNFKIEYKWCVCWNIP